MTMNLIGIDAVSAANTQQPRLATLVLAKTISIVAGIARMVIKEVVHTLHEDGSHGQISRDPADWERD